MTPVTVEIDTICGSLAGELAAATGVSPMTCYQCAKCSSGCPVAGRGDLRSHELVRLVQMDQRQAVLSSRFIWECTSCQTCVTRCPQKVDIGAMNDALRAISLREGLVAAGTAVPVFNEAFLAGVRKRGRIHELGLMATFKLRTKRFFEDFDKAPMMLKKGKLPLFGGRVGGRSEREKLFKRASDRLLKKDVSPPGRRVLGGMRDGQAQDKNAQSVNSSAIGATEDDVLRRPARSDGRDFLSQQPPKGGKP
jgi:heterodisulfide reductase subunit C